VKKLYILIFVLISQVFISVVFAEQKVYKEHAFALHGDVKYELGFKHFDYVNPNAPKGGTVRLATIGSYDSLNPFILKGVPAVGIGLIFDTLTYQSDDEPFAVYGLIAEIIEIPEDRSWVAFKLRKEARWHDGTSVTSDDVIFTFTILTEKGSPFYRYYYADVEKVERISKRKVKFVFRNCVNPELPLILGQLPIISKKYYSKNKFEKTNLKAPLGSGPYKILDVKPGRSITYKRDPSYWGKNLPVNKGRWNFDVIRFEYYLDETILVEAFKAKEYDFRLENVSKIWATAYKGTKFEKGLIIKEELLNENPTGMQAWVFNTRKEIFKDKNVRLALTYAFDYEWTNKTLFYNQYTRTKSYFSNSELASSGLPDSAELELLETFRNKIPPEVFRKKYEPPSTAGTDSIRLNLRLALELLQKAGWELKEGKLINSKSNEQFKFEFLIFQPSTERIIIPFQKNLKRIGVEMDISTVDSSQYINRIDHFDFDMTTIVWGQSLSPGNEQLDFWSSEAADRFGSRNLAGIKDPVVDVLIEKIITAPDRENLITACKGLDRVLLWGYYSIPNWHIKTYRIAYWNKFGRPEIKPKYSLGFMDTWWVDPNKEKKLELKK
jgi:microcin C transport system substrate-binding protein